MARLPEPGGDDGTWGDILNQYLSIEHNPDGTLKNTGTLAEYATKSYADSVASTSTPDATTQLKGKIQLTGDLAGTASSPQIAAGAIVDADINNLANISQSKISNLSNDLLDRVSKGGDISTGEQTAPSFRATGKSGATATPITLAGGTSSGAPVTGNHIKGEVVVDDSANIWYCTASGTPGVWLPSGGSDIEAVNIVPASGTTLGLDAGGYDIHDITVTSDCSVTLANVQSSRSLVLRFSGDGSSSHIVTLPGGSTLVVTPTMIRFVVTAVTVNGGASWDYYPAGEPSTGALSDSSNASMQIIAEQELSSAASEFTFSNIPSGYRNLQLSIVGRVVDAAQIVPALIRCNNDSSNNYGTQTLVGGNNASGASAVTSASSGRIGYFTGTQADSGHFSHFNVDILGYSSTVFEKEIVSRSSRKVNNATANFAVDLSGVSWWSTAAINQISIFASGTNIAEGSIAALYGVRGT